MFRPLDAYGPILESIHDACTKPQVVGNEMRTVAEEVVKRISKRHLDG